MSKGKASFADELAVATEFYLRSTAALRRAQLSGERVGAWRRYDRAMRETAAAIDQLDTLLSDRSRGEAERLWHEIEGKRREP